MCVLEKELSKELRSSRKVTGFSAKKLVIFRFSPAETGFMMPRNPEQNFHP
jgi:hypothetical protein